MISFITTDKVEERVDSQFKVIFFDVLKCDSTFSWEKKVANYNECPQISPYGGCLQVYLYHVLGVF